MNAVKWYVNTYIHVGTSDRKLLRDFYDRMKCIPEYMTPAMRKERKKVYRDALSAHNDHRNLVRDFRL